MNFLVVLIGGGIGAVSRFGLSRFIAGLIGHRFPVGTLAVNLIGCFIAGLLFGVFDKVAISQNLRVLIFVGFLGGFTTFSAFSLETLTLLKNRDFSLALINILISNVGGLALAFAGFWIADMLLKVRG